MFCKARSNTIKFFDDYSLMVSEAKNEATKAKGLTILTRKQLLQRLPIPLAHVHASNNLESLLNEIKLFILCINQRKSLKNYTITQLNQYKNKK